MNINEKTQHTEQLTLPFPERDPVAATEKPEGVTLTTLQAENAQLKDQLKLRDAHDDLTHKLKKAGARTPKLLFEAAKDALRFTAEGLVENADDVVANLKTRFPEQFGKHASVPTHMSIGAGSGRAVEPTLTREALARMKPEEIAKLDWADVRRVLSN